RKRGAWIAQYVPLGRVGIGLDRQRAVCLLDALGVAQHRVADQPVKPCQLLSIIDNHADQVSPTARSVWDDGQSRQRGISTSARTRVKHRLAVDRDGDNEIV